MPGTFGILRPTVFSWFVPEASKDDGCTTNCIQSQIIFCQNSEILQTVFWQSIKVYSSVGIFNGATYDLSKTFLPHLLNRIYSDLTKTFRN